MTPAFLGSALLTSVFAPNRPATIGMLILNTTASAPTGTLVRAFMCNFEIAPDGGNNQEGPT